MKKKKPLFKKLDFGIWNGSCNFIVGANFAQIKAHFSKDSDSLLLQIMESNQALLSSSYGLTIKEKLEGIKTKRIRTYYFIILQEFNFKDNYDIATLGHEIVHLCQFFLPEILQRDREIEAEAYFHSYVMKQCLDHLRNW